MATIVTGDLYIKLDGKLCEIKRQIRQSDGYHFDPQQLDVALQALVDGRFQAVGGLFPSQIHVPELIPEYTDGKGKKRKWEVVEDVEPTSDLDVKKLKFISFLKSGEECVEGDEMRQRAVRLKGNFGLSDAPRFLTQHKDIPVELRGKYIVLPGTKLRDPDGGLGVPCLGFLGDQWVLGCCWLGRGWRGDGRLACGE